MHFLAKPSIVDTLGLNTFGQFMYNDIVKYEFKTLNMYDYGENGIIIAKILTVIVR